MRIYEKVLYKIVEEIESKKRELIEKGITEMTIVVPQEVDWEKVMKGPLLEASVHYDHLMNKEMTIVLDLNSMKDKENVK